MTRSRRTVLAAVGTSLVSAGCLGSGPGRGPVNGNGTDPTPTDGPASTPTATPGGPFADVACPSFTETDRTVCWHTRPDDAPVVLEPETTAFEPVADNQTVETVAFTLRNRSEQSFGLNPYAWQLQVRADDGWRRVAPDQWIEPWDTVAPGETWEWILATRQHPTPSEERVVRVFQDVDDGTYAFAVHGFLGEGTDDATGIECVALFDVTWADDQTTETAADG